MPLFMLDTNMCIYLMKHQPEQVAMRFAQCYIGDVVMSAITHVELVFGVTASKNSARERRNLASLIDDIPVMPFDAAAAAAYGPIRQASRERKKDQLDKPISAHAVSLNVIPVTNNERDFAAYPLLKIENWLKE